MLFKILFFFQFEFWRLNDAKEFQKESNCQPDLVSRVRLSFPVSLRIRLISGGLEPVLSHTEILCLASSYIQFSTNIKCTTIRLKPVF